MTKSKKHHVGEGTLRKIQLGQYKSELEKLESDSKENYKPKFGRLMKQLKKKIEELTNSTKKNEPNS